MSGRGGRGGRGAGGAKRGAGGGGRGGRGRGGRAAEVELPGGAQLEESMGQVTQPPPIFPPIEHKAPKLEITDEWPYLFELKRDYAESLFESMHNVDVNKKKDIERWSDRLAAEMVTRSRYDKFCDWSIIPKELKPRGEKRKGAAVTNQAKATKSKDVDIQAKLAKLEAEEQTEKEPGDLEEEEKSSDEEDDEDKDPEEDLEKDEEMDEGTDYANNYFKNGEEDEEDDDVYEEGGVF